MKVFCVSLSHAIAWNEFYADAGLCRNELFKKFYHHFLRLQFIPLPESHQTGTESGIKMYVVQQRHIIAVVASFPYTLTYVYTLRKIKWESAKISVNRKGKRERNIHRQNWDSRSRVEATTENAKLFLCYAFYHYIDKGNRSWILFFVCEEATVESSNKLISLWTVKRYKLKTHCSFS